MTNANKRGAWVAAMLALSAVAPSARGSSDAAMVLCSSCTAAKATRKTPALPPPNPPDAHPHIGAASPSSPETPGRSELITAFRRVAPSVWDCAQTHAGVVFVRVHFSPTGAVASLEFTSSNRTRRELACMGRAIRQARVSRFGSATFAVNYPFNVGGVRPEPLPPPAPPRPPPSPARAACANRCRGNIACLLRCSMGP